MEVSRSASNYSIGIPSISINFSLHFLHFLICKLRISFYVYRNIGLFSSSSIPSSCIKFYFEYISLQYSIHQFIKSFSMIFFTLFRMSIILRFHLQLNLLMLVMCFEVMSLFTAVSLYFRIFSCTLFDCFLHFFGHLVCHFISTTALTSCLDFGTLIFMVSCVSFPTFYDLYD